MSDTATILEKLEDYTQREPHAAILFDETHTSGITYAQLDDMSGRIYAWLKEEGIGKDQFVLINLPRGIMPVISMIGVWKAGAAWALVEDTYAPERIEYIRKDCGCTAELNAGNWDRIMALEPLSGYEKADSHDAAYAIYTSGTTGNPKGVLHEYGNLERAVNSVMLDGKSPLRDGQNVATLSPLNFVASVIVVLFTLNTFKVKNYIASYATIKNPVELGKLLLTKKINAIFLTPSYARMFGNNKSPYLEKLFVGSEPANDLYMDGLELINIYACSESGCAMGVFRIDRPYPVCPIGRPVLTKDARIILFDEDGREVTEPGETGEFCFENPYVRGYINLPEATQRAFVDGIYHSGDLAKQDENGNYILLGRKDDMIKINGNRIEPAEIEAAVKDELGIDWCAAKGFETDGRSFLCAYYTADVSFDADELRKKLQERLPSYMIPAYFIRIDQIPLKPNGKLDRKALPAPQIEVRRENYAAPENEVQEKLCTAMAGVLKLEQMGIHDDFYELGGDSLKAIELVSSCDLPGLSTAEIFQGRTPSKIAELYEKAQAENAEGSPETRNAEAMKKAHPLTTEQQYMVDYQLYTPASTMYNLFSMMKVDKNLISMEEASRMMKESIAAHPSLMTTFFWNEDGVLMQKYTPEILTDIEVEQLSEFEMEFVKDTLVYPFKIVGGKLHRCRIFETEKNGYIFFDVHHSVFDGTSMKVFMNSVRNALFGTPQEPDYYYLMLDRREHAEGTENFEESRRYFEDRYGNTEWSSYPRTDHMSRDNETGELAADLGIEQEEMSVVEQKNRITRNEFFITVGALATSFYNNAPNIRLSWIYNGREDMQLMKTVGLLFRDLPVGIRFRDTLSIKDVYKDVHEQVSLGIEHCVYPYVELHDEVATKETAYLLYQQDIRDMNGLDDLNIEMVDVRQNQAASQTILDMQILDGEEGLMLAVDFAASRYKESSMLHFMQIFVGIAHILVENPDAELTVGQIRAKLAEQAAEESGDGEHESFSGSGARGGQQSDLIKLGERVLAAKGLADGMKLLPGMMMPLAGAAHPLPGMMMPLAGAAHPLAGAAHPLAKEVMPLATGHVPASITMAPNIVKLGIAGVKLERKKKKARHGFNVMFRRKR